MRAEGTEYRGFLYAGLMMTLDLPVVWGNRNWEPYVEDVWHIPTNHFDPTAAIREPRLR